MNPSVLCDPLSRGTAGAESLRIRTGNVFTPGKFINPAEQSTGGLFMFRVSADVYMYCLELMNGYFNGSQKNN